MSRIFRRSQSAYEGFKGIKFERARSPVQTPEAHFLSERHGTVLHFTNKKGQPVEVPMCIVYCFDETGKLSEERVYIDEARMMP